MVSTSSAALPRKISRPPRRSSRAASGIQRYGSHQIAAPYSLIARSKLASASGTRLGAALDEREVQVMRVLERSRCRQLVL